MKILGSAANGGASFIIQKNSGLESIENYSGKRVAAPQISNTQDVSLRHYLYENGLKPAEKGGDVFVLNISNPDIYTLFAKGDIDGAWVPEPWATMLVEELNGVRLFDENEISVLDLFKNKNNIIMVAAKVGNVRLIDNLLIS